MLYVLLVVADLPPDFTPSQPLATSTNLSELISLQLLLLTLLLRLLPSESAQALLVSECKNGLFATLLTWGLLVSEKPGAAPSDLAMGEEDEDDGKEEDEDSMSEGFLHGLLHPPKRFSEKSSEVHIESRVPSELEEPSSELLLNREELSLGESSSSIRLSWWNFE